MDILNKTVVDPLLKKELLVASKDSTNIIIIDETLSQGSSDSVDFEAIKRDLLSDENSSKLSNNRPVVCTNTSVVQNH